MAVSFDGSTYLSRSTPLLISDSKELTFHTWIKPSDLSTHNCLLQNKVATTGNSSLYILLRSTGELQLLGRNVAGTKILETISTDASITTDTWYHIVASIQLSSATVAIYLNGTALTLTTATATDDELDLSVDEWRVGLFLGQTANADYYYNGIMEDMFLKADYIDLSTDLNLRRFYGNTGLYSSSGTKVGLGPGGRAPFGSAAELLLTHSAGNFGTNAGTGGDFAITGTLTADYGRAPNVESLARGFKGREWRESERSGIPFSDDQLVIEPATGLEVHHKREYSTDRDQINRNRRFGRRRFEY